MRCRRYARELAEAFARRATTGKCGCWCCGAPAARSAPAATANMEKRDAARRRRHGGDGGLEPPLRHVPGDGSALPKARVALVEGAAWAVASVSSRSRTGRSPSEARRSARRRSRWASCRRRSRLSWPAHRHAQARRLTAFGLRLGAEEACASGWCTRWPTARRSHRRRRGGQSGPALRPVAVAETKRWCASPSTRRWARRSTLRHTCSPPRGRRGQGGHRRFPREAQARLVGKDRDALIDDCASVRRFAARDGDAGFDGGHLGHRSHQPAAMTSFRTILVANRGEIACRIMRTARAMGYRMAAVYSEPTRRAARAPGRHRGAASAPPKRARATSSIEAIIAAAAWMPMRCIRATASCPRMPRFAQAVLDAGLVFIGPTPAAIAAMGNKAAAKRRMIEAGVPCVPGFQGETSDARFRTRRSASASR